MSLDLRGQKFGMLFVESLSHSTRQGRFWKCVCDCGNNAVVGVGALRSGNTKSCGCGVRAATIARSTRHGACTNGITPEYRVWAEMVARCTNKNHKRFADYGGRGICVCNEWASDFAAFIAHVGPRPVGSTGKRASFEIDRIDNGSGYVPGNVEWATTKKNQRHKRDSSFVTAFGETLTQAEWCERTGLKQSTLSRRLNSGWHAERAISTLVKDTSCAI
jgi:hypothetical protein